MLKVIKEGRLQRGSLNSEIYISKFRQVLLRHGLTMSLIAAFCIFIPFIPSVLFSSLSNLYLVPNKYLFWIFCVGVMILIFLKSTNRDLNIRQIFWIIYLFIISLVEEIAFRLSIPLIATEFFGTELFWFYVFLSNILFASIHYFTLRWKIRACILAFLGGMAFSRVLESTEDLALLIILHWAITFLNTPTAPKIENLAMKN